MKDWLLENITLSNFLLLGVFFVILVAYKKGVKTIPKVGWGLILLILLITTRYLPAQLIAFEEAKVPQWNIKNCDTTQMQYIHVLGAGFSADTLLAPTSQLNTTTLARLVEAIRIARQLPHYKIVTSGNTKYGGITQAEVVKKAAIALGIPKQNILTLTTPSNTAEEVDAFIKKLGKNKKGIVVSDALHLPRALMLYQKAGIHMQGAPTNYNIKKGPHDYNGFTLPSYNSLSAMNTYLREKLKYYKDSW